MTFWFSNVIEFPSLILSFFGFDESVGYRREKKKKEKKKKDKFFKRNKNMFCEQFYFWISTQKNSGRTLNRYLDAPCHLSAIHNSQKVEAAHARLPPHGFADRLCGILFSFKKEGHSGSLNNTDGPWRRDAKWNKPDTKDTYCVAPCSSDTDVI